MVTNHQFWAPCQNGGRDRPRIVHFSQLWKLRDLDLDLWSGRGHTGAHMWSRSTHQIRWKSEKNFVDVRTDGRRHLSSNLRWPNKNVTTNPPFKGEPTTLIISLANRGNGGGVSDLENFRMAVINLQFQFKSALQPRLACQQLSSTCFLPMSLKFNPWAWRSSLT